MAGTPNFELKFNDSTSTHDYLYWLRRSRRARWMPLAAAIAACIAAFIVIAAFSPVRRIGLSATDGTVIAETIPLYEALEVLLNYGQPFRGLVRKYDHVDTTLVLRQLVDRELLPLMRTSNIIDVLDASRKDIHLLTRLIAQLEYLIRTAPQGLPEDKTRVNFRNNRHVGSATVYLLLMAQKMGSNPGYCLPLPDESLQRMIGLTPEQFTDMRTKLHETAAA